MTPIVFTNTPLNLESDLTVSLDDRLTVIDAMIQRLVVDHKDATLLASQAETNYRRTSAQKPNRWQPVMQKIRERAGLLEIAFEIYDAIGVSDVVDQACRAYNSANAYEGALIEIQRDLQVLRHKLRPIAY